MAREIRELKLRGPKGPMDEFVERCGKGNVNKVLKELVKRYMRETAPGHSDQPPVQILQEPPRQDIAPAREDDIRMPEDWTPPPRQGGEHDGHYTVEGPPSPSGRKRYCKDCNAFFTPTGVSA
jgi:hypothetical protein